MKRKRLFSSVGGFTLIELLVCSVLLSLAAAGVLNLMRLSDASALRGQLDSRAALVFRDIVDRISSMPFAEFESAVAGASNVGPNGAIFDFGRPPGEFPFIEGEDASAPKYLLWGKPLPGEDTPTGRYPYIVRVEAEEDPSGDFYRVRVTVIWEAFRDRLVEGSLEPAERSVLLEFQKWDASQS